MGFLLANDGINGKAGSAFMVKNGRNIELFGLKKYETNAEVETSKGSSIPALLRFIMGHRNFLTFYLNTKETGDFLRSISK